jgi:hypothetical protein
MAKLNNCKWAGLIAGECRMNAIRAFKDSQSHEELWYT